MATSVSPTDWKVRSGARQKDVPLDLPASLGGNLSGVVRVVGSEVRAVSVGDRVIALADVTARPPRTGANRIFVRPDAASPREIAGDVRDAPFYLPFSA